MQVPAPDVGDKRDLGLEGCDVGEILFRTDSNVNTALFRAPEEVRNDVLQPILV